MRGALGILRSGLIGVHGAFDDVRQNPVRSALTVSGIAVGIAAVVGTGLLMAASLDLLSTQLGRLVGLQTIHITYTSATKKGGRWIPARIPNPFTQRDLDQVEKLLGDRLTAGSLRIPSTSIVEWPGGSDAITVDASDPDLATVRQLRPSEGRFLDAADLRETRRVAVVTQRLANRVAGGQSAIGKELRIGPARFRIVGVVVGSSPVGDDEERTVFIPRTVAAANLSGSGPPNAVLHFQVRPDLDVDDVARVVKSILLSLHPGIDAAAVEAHTATKMREQAVVVLAFIGFIFLVIASLCLFTGGVGVMNTLLTTVSERTREIGLRRALGARERDIFVQFFFEAAALAAIGGVVGIVVGLALSVGLSALVTALLSYATNSNELRLTSTVDVAVIGSASFIIEGIALAFGVYPAYRASSLQPVDALRHE